MKFGARTGTALFLACALSVFTPTSFALDVAGVKLADTERLASQDLKLNGAGVRYKAIFKVYVAGLYLSDKKATVPDVLAASGAKRVTIVMLRDVGNEELGRGFMVGIQQNTDKAEKAKLVVQLQKFGEMFATIPELKKGDTLTADWIPGSGTLVHLNGKKVGDVIPDEAFYSALLRIWLGEKPVDNQLKRSMLGEKNEEASRSKN